MKNLKTILAISILGGALTVSSAALIVNSVMKSAKGASEAATLERCDGYKLRFKANNNATKYVVHDATDYRDGLVLTNLDKDENGYIYYETETVGTHNVIIDTYVDGNSYSSNILTITNKPMLFYGTPNCVKFYDINTNTKTNSNGDYVYSVLQNDGSFLICTQQEFDTIYNKEKGNAVDFSDAEHVDEIVTDIKNTGANVLFLGHRLQSVESNYSYWWFKSFEDSVVKRFMDAAWKVGMKCIITDTDIMNNCYSGNVTLINNRLSNAEFRKALLHPAFLGLQFEDEPTSNEVTGVSTNEIAGAGVSVKAIFNYWQNDNELKNRPLPMIFTSLRSYDENKSAEFGYFQNQDAYKNYIKSWINETGLDYFTFDTYTYSTRYYGIKSSWGSKYYYDPSKVIYDAINEAKNELGKDIKVYQTITSGVDPSRKTETHYYDVFSSTFLAASQDVSGYALYQYSESISTKSACLSLDNKFNNTYFYIQKANKQYRQIQSLLDGYKMTSNSISINGNYFSNSLYGRGVRTSTSTFTNQLDNSKTYQFITNFESDSTNSTYNVTIPNGQIYYLFGYNQETYQRVGKGASVSLNNGEAILISSEYISNVSDTSFDKSRLDDFDVITIRDLMGKESVNKLEGFGNASNINTDFVRYPIINSSNGSVALRFNYRCNRLGSDWDDGLVDIYINNTWSDNGHGYSIGCNSGDVHLKDANIIVHNVLKANEDNIVEVGAIKIKNSSQTYTYIKVNNELINEAVIDTKSSYSVVQAYSTIGENEDIGVTLHSVNLNRKGSGLLKNTSGNASNINFSCANSNNLPYKFEDGTSLSFVSTNNNTLTKSGYNSFSLNLSQRASAHQKYDLKDYFYCYFNNQKYYYEIDENHLYFTGSSWLSIGDLDQVSSSMLLSYSCQISGSVIRNDHFKMKFMINDQYSEQLNQLGEFGIYVSTSSQSKYYPYSMTHEDALLNNRYVIIDLGAAITNNHQDDVFTVCAYLKINDEIILSNKSTSGSITSIVTDLYENEITRPYVEKLYQYLAG